jgi:hypothetical protein
VSPDLREIVGQEASGTVAMFRFIRLGMSCKVHVRFDNILFRYLGRANEGYVWSRHRVEDLCAASFRVMAASHLPITFSNTSRSAWANILAHRSFLISPFDTRASVAKNPCPCVLIAMQIIPSFPPSSGHTQTRRQLWTAVNIMHWLASASYIST